MNKKNSIIVLFIIIIIGGLTVGWYWQTNPDRQIRKILATMAELGSAPVGESPIVKAVKSRKLEGYFSADGFIEWPGDEVIPAGRWTGGKQIAEQVLAAKNSAIYEVKIDNLTVEAERRDRGAEAKFTLVVREGLNTTWAWLGEARFVRAGSSWLATQLIFAPILRR